jgi:hypothetical protein
MIETHEHTGNFREFLGRLRRVYECRKRSQCLTVRLLRSRLPWAASGEDSPFHNGLTAHRSAGATRLALCFCFCWVATLHRHRSRSQGQVFEGQTAWEGTVEVFDLVGHPKAKRAYAWSYRDGNETKCVAVLEIPPVDSPQNAVKVAIAAKAKKI